MFEGGYSFSGKHSSFLAELTAKLNEQYKTCIFARNVDVLILAPIIGIVYGRQSPKDTINSNEVKVRTINAEQTCITEGNTLNYVYQLVMLAHNKDKDDIDLRMRRAFRYNNKKDEEFKNECTEIFDSYVRGGIEILYEKIIGDYTEEDDYINNLYTFIDEFNTRYYIKFDDRDDMYRKIERE